MDDALQIATDALRAVNGVIAEHGCYCDSDDGCDQTCIGGEIAKVVADALAEIERVRGG